MIKKCKRPDCKATVHSDAPFCITHTRALEQDHQIQLEEKEKSQRKADQRKENAREGVTTEPPDVEPNQGAMLFDNPSAKKTVGPGDDSLKFIKCESCNLYIRRISALSKENTQYKTIGDSATLRLSKAYENLKIIKDEYKALYGQIEVAGEKTKQMTKERDVLLNEVRILRAQRDNALAIAVSLTKIH